MGRDTTETHTGRISPDGRYAGPTPGQEPPSHPWSRAAWTGWLVALVPLGLTVFFASLLGAVTSGGTTNEQFGYA